MGTASAAKAQKEPSSTLPKAGTQLLDALCAYTKMSRRPVDCERTHFRDLRAEWGQLAAPDDLSPSSRHHESRRVDGELIERAWQEMPFDQVRRNKRVDVARVVSFGGAKGRSGRSGHSVCPLLSHVGQLYPGRASFVDWLL